MDQNHQIRQNKMKDVISKVAACFCAVIIMFILLFVMGAFIEADFRTRSIAGNNTTSLFSYIRNKDDNTAVLKAFGESITVNFDMLDAARDRFNYIAAVNSSYTPSFIRLSSAMLRSGISSVGEWFGRVPNIIVHLLESAELIEPTQVIESVEPIEAIEDSTE